MNSASKGQLHSGTTAQRVVPNGRARGFVGVNMAFALGIRPTCRGEFTTFQLMFVGALGPMGVDTGVKKSTHFSLRTCVKPLNLVLHNVRFCDLSAEVRRTEESTCRNKHVDGEAY
ncbi:hypothetical protein CIHG_02476 [Coccidioides immitis H538.4]|uniref:Uncharacterized protein n=1 Tax=Coccidioides immitis H538.4 TaxID=396776 RepID=A0A0J8RJ47_COCIT|nr:hypothetical protein CIHG_02476 [Coccidioides immitis H538.4]